MIEKVNPSHPDKVADRIAGALVDMAYAKQADPRIAVECLIGHGHCHIICETSAHLTDDEVRSAVVRISRQPGIGVDYREVPQDAHLADNQAKGVRCGDNGIFRGAPITAEQRRLSRIARFIYDLWPYDGKYLLDGDKLVICQSNAKSESLLGIFPAAIVNPLGDWTGGTDVDTGAVNRKLGSDMADGITGGGLHGKDLSKGDVSINIHAFIKAQREGRPVEISCAIGDELVDGAPYQEIVEEARRFVGSLGGFERLAEWGLF